MGKKIDRIMFGKKYIESKTSKEKERILKRSYYFMLFSFFLMFIAFLMAFFQISDFYFFEETSLPKNNTINITYDELNEKEIDFFEDVFSEVNPLYLTNQQKIIVTKNISKYCSECTNNVMGINYNHGKKIIIKYRNNQESLKRTITHEFLHTYFKDSFGVEGQNGTEISPIHKIIYQLGELKVAFNK